MILDTTVKLCFIHIVQIIAGGLSCVIAEWVERVGRIHLHVAAVAFPVVQEHVLHHLRPRERLREPVHIRVELRDAPHEVQPKGVPRRRVDERVLDVRPVRRRLHIVHDVSENEVVPFEEVLERTQAHVVEIRVNAAEAMHIQVPHRIDPIDVPPEASVPLKEPGVLIGHKLLVFRVGPQNMNPVGLVEALSPRLGPVRESRRQAPALPALVNDRHKCPGVAKCSIIVVIESIKRPSRLVTN